MEPGSANVQWHIAHPVDPSTPQNEARHVYWFQLGLLFTGLSVPSMVALIVALAVHQLIDAALVVSLLFLFSGVYLLLAVWQDWPLPAVPAHPRPQSVEQALETVPFVARVTDTTTHRPSTRPVGGQRLRGTVKYGIEGRDTEIDVNALLVPLDAGVIVSDDGTEYLFRANDLVRGVPLHAVLKGQRVAFNDIAEPTLPTWQQMHQPRHARDVQPATG